MVPRMIVCVRELRQTIQLLRSFGTLVDTGVEIDQVDPE
jgi:hypothetical protein